MPYDDPRGNSNYDRERHSGSYNGNRENNGRHSYRKDDRRDYTETRETESYPYEYRDNDNRSYDSEYTRKKNMESYRAKLSPSEYEYKKYSKPSPSHFSEENYGYQDSYRGFKNREQPYSSGDYRAQDPYRRKEEESSTFSSNQYRNSYYNPRSSENSSYKMSDLDYISNSESSRKYESYNKRDDPVKRNEDSFKRSKTDYKSPPYDSAAYKTQKSKRVSADPNNTLGLFGLHHSTTDEDLNQLLEDKLKGLKGYTYKLIVDDRTGFCKGFCFIDFVSLNDAITAKFILNSESFRGQDFKCDYSYRHGIMGENY